MMKGGRSLQQPAAGGHGASSQQRALQRRLPRGFCAPARLSGTGREATALLSSTWARTNKVSLSTWAAAAPPVSAGTALRRRGRTQMALFSSNCGARLPARGKKGQVARPAGAAVARRKESSRHHAAMLAPFRRREMRECHGQHAALSGFAEQHRTCCSLRTSFWEHSGPYLQRRLT